MTISEHKTSFAGHPIVEWEPGDPIEDPTGTNYRIASGFNFDESRQRTSKPKTTWMGRFEAFIATPQAPQVYGLVVGPWDLDSIAESSAPVIQAIAHAHDRVPNLRALFIGDIIYEECEISWINQSDMSPILRTYPALQHFGVRGGEGLSLGKLNHAALRSLIIETGGLPAQVVQEVSDAHLPELTHLELWLGTDEYGGDATIDDLQPILSGELFPKLKYLGLRDSEMADQVAEAVALAPILAQIEELDLSMGNLSDLGAQSLLSSTTITKLRRLNLSHHYCSDEMVAKLSALPIEVDTSEQLTPDEDQPDAAQYRFIAVSE